MQVAGGQTMKKKKRKKKEDENILEAALHLLFWGGIRESSLVKCTVKLRRLIP